jgi:hypothetical protein
MSTGAGSGLGYHEARNQMLAMQLAVDSVSRETIEIRIEMRENNMTMTRKGEYFWHHHNREL